MEEDICQVRQVIFKVTQTKCYEMILFASVLVGSMV
jgi:hypothetical protein